MDVFDKSLKGSGFKEQLNRAVSHFERNEYYYAENELRTALTIFTQSENLKSYTYPEDASMEKAMLLSSDS
jgi:hypothetical protein